MLTLSEVGRVVVDVAQSNVDCRRSGQTSQLTRHVFSLNDDLVLTLDLSVHIRQRHTHLTYSQRDEDRSVTSPVSQISIIADIIISDLLIPFYHYLDANATNKVLIKGVALSFWC